MFGRKKVDLGGSKQDRKDLIRNAKKKRVEREEHDKREAATIVFQKSYRGSKERRLVYKRAVDEFKHISTEIAAQAKTKKKGKRGSTISRLLYITSLLIRLQKSQPSLDKKSKALHARRVQAALVYVVARAKKTDKGNYFLGLVDRNMRRRKECANQLSFFARVGAQMVAEMKDRKQTKSRALILRFVAMTLNPNLMALANPKNCYIAYPQHITIAFAEGKGVAYWLGRAIQGEKDKKGAMIVAMIQLGFRGFWLDDATGNASKPATTAFVSNILTLPVAFSKPSNGLLKLMFSPKTSNSGFVTSAWDTLTQAILVMSRIGALDKLRCGGITAPPIAFLFGNLLSIWQHGQSWGNKKKGEDLGAEAKMTRAEREAERRAAIKRMVPFMTMITIVIQRCPETCVKPLMETIQRGGHSIGNVLSSQLRIAFSPGHNNLLNMPFQLILHSTHLQDLKYTYRPNEKEWAETDEELRGMGLDVFRQVPGYLGQVVRMLIVMCKYWPGKRHSILSALAFTTPCLPIMWGYLETHICPLNHKGTRRKRAKSKQGDSKFDQKVPGGYAYEALESQSTQNSRGVEKKIPKPQKKSSGLLSFLSKGIATAVRKVSGYGRNPIMDTWLQAIYAPPAQSVKSSQLADIFYLFAGAFSSAIAGLEMDEMAGMISPVQLGEGGGVEYMIRMVKNIVFDFYFHRNTLPQPQRPWLGIDPQTSASQADIASISMALLTQFRQKYVRVAFCVESAWEVESSYKSAFLAKWNKWANGRLTTSEGFIFRDVLWRLPFLVSFEQRAKALRIVFKSELKEAAAQQRRIHTVNIRRTHLVADGWDAIKAMGSGLRNKIAIRFFDKNGQAEAGLDMGGPFKEFLEGLCREIFRAEYGLFKPTDSGCYYPNEASVLLPDWQEQLEFVGKVLGKALMEGHLIEVRFASFFLNHLLNRPAHFDDLKSVDTQLHKNLVFVKQYQGAMEDLCLTFSVSRSIFGATKTIPLIPGGEDIDVTKANRIHYVTLLADYHLNRKIQPQTSAFKRGLFSVVAESWLTLFTSQELKTLLSGSEDSNIDVDDLRRYTQIDARGSFPSPSVISWFWSAVRALSPHQRRLLLKFVTACSHPPLLGFKDMSPPFTIRFVPLEDRSPAKTKPLLSRIFDRNPKTGQLPTAATCFNMLKLPLYRSQKALTEKLIMAIESKAGFDLQ
ncbi:hypothetical protein AAMO2058_000635600 [Amorphochlora amoebiformis]|mmetsp:Transcript_17806/g.28381  ORF Transcript_17806/g.28381 Transcript_17806/m.28381 type:complete len:1185 (-) Transcript_17806:163-3717(-)